MEYLSKDNLRILLSRQLSVTLFCSTLISTVAPLLLDHLNRDSPWITSTNRQGSPLPTVSASYVYLCLLVLDCAVEMMELESAKHTEHVQDLMRTEHVQDLEGHYHEEKSDDKVSMYKSIIR